MAQVRVDLGERSYQIIIGAGLLDRLGELVKNALPRVGKALVVSDSNTSELYGERVRAALEAAGIQAAAATVPAGEGSKSLEQAANLYTACAGAMLERSSVIVALGGGVVGDLAGFVAATWLRGVPFVQVPTTLLAQADSSVGGKTGVDLPQGKNLVGAFHQPALVVADVSTLASLPQRERNAGMAEVVKHGVIRDAAFLGFLEEHAERIVALDPAIMEAVVETNCRIKAGVVSADEREGGLRAILNFGHTLGHAVEARLGYGAFLHGECVAVGMIAAATLARDLGVLQEEGLPERLQRLLARLSLPIRLPDWLTYEELAPLMQMDKKVEAGRIRWVLPNRAGLVLVTPDVPAEAVRLVVDRLRG